MWNSEIRTAGRSFLLLVNISPIRDGQREGGGGGEILKGEVSVDPMYSLYTCLSFHTLSFSPSSSSFSLYFCLSIEPLLSFPGPLAVVIYWNTPAATAFVSCCQTALTVQCGVSVDNFIPAGALKKKKKK